MRPKLKVLCICRGGVVRSVALKQILIRYLDHDALACGMDNSTHETREMLYEWADNIIVLHNDFAGYVPAHWQFKVAIYHIGEDIWGNPCDPDLRAKLVPLIQEDLLIGRTLTVKKVLDDLTRYQEKLIKRRLESKTNQ